MAASIALLVMVSSLWLVDAGQRMHKVHAKIKLLRESRPNHSEFGLEPNIKAPPHVFPTDVALPDDNAVGHAETGLGCAGGDCEVAKGAFVNLVAGQSPRLPNTLMQFVGHAPPEGLPELTAYGTRTFSGFQIERRNVPGRVAPLLGCAGEGCDVAKEVHSSPTSARNQSLSSSRTQLIHTARLGAVSRDSPDGKRTFSGFQIERGSIPDRSAASVDCAGAMGSNPRLIMRAAPVYASLWKTLRLNPFASTPRTRLRPRLRRVRSLFRGRRLNFFYSMPYGTNMEKRSGDGRVVNAPTRVRSIDDNFKDCLIQGAARIIPEGCLYPARAIT